MARNLNPHYLRRIMMKDDIRGLAVVYLTGNQFGVSTHHPSRCDYKTKQISGNTILSYNDAYRGWTQPGKLYCATCWKELRGIPREIIQRNWCEKCKSHLYDSEDDDRFDFLGYSIYRDRVSRYTGIAVRNFSDAINGSKYLLSSERVKDGYHKDHVFSVRDAFEFNIDETIVSSPPNIHVIEKGKNLSKGRKSEFDLQELLDRYHQFAHSSPEWLRLVSESDNREMTFVPEVDTGLLVPKSKPV